MLSFKELLKKGITIQEKASNVVIYSDIENLDELDINDLSNKNYYPEECEQYYNDADYSFWIGYNGFGKDVSINELEDILNNYKTPDDVVDYLKSLR